MGFKTVLEGQPGEGSGQEPPVAEGDGSTTWYFHKACYLFFMNTSDWQTETKPKVYDLLQVIPLM